MLSIVATLIIGIIGIVVFFIDESHTAFGLSFMVLVCACVITLHSDYSKDNIIKLGRLKFFCIISMAMICFQLFTTGFRIRKQYGEGDRFAVITPINYMAAEVFLVYSLICTIVTLNKTVERKSLRNPSTTI